MPQNSHEVALNKILDEAPLTRQHWRVWFLSAMGIFLDGFDLFIIGVALPVIQHVGQWHITPFLEGALGIAALLGAVFGAALIGYMTDRFGRKKFYIADQGFVIITALLCGLSWNIYSLIFFRFLLGVAIGADYPISASYISEFVPSRIRGRMLIAGFSFQAIGMLAASLSGLLILKIFQATPDISWRFMLMFVIVPSTFVMFMRMGVPESTRWLLTHGHSKKAAKIIARFVPAKKKIIQEIVAEEKQQIQNAQVRALGYRSLFSQAYIRRTLLVAVPWFCMDVATYGIGIFTPILLVQMFHGDVQLNFFNTEWKAVEGAAFVDLFLIVGFALNILLVEKLGRIKLQMLGFLGMVAGLVMLGVVAFMPGGPSVHIPLVFLGFIIFNLLMNMGPNATTYMLPVELFPTEIRATAHGFAAACAKVGATVGTLCLPLMQANKYLGLSGTMFVVAGFAFVGLLITYALRIEPKGKSLDELQAWEAGEAVEHIRIKNR